MIAVRNRKDELIVEENAPVRQQSASRQSDANGGRFQIFRFQIEERHSPELFEPQLAVVLIGGEQFDGEAHDAVVFQYGGRHENAFLSISSISMLC